MTPEIERREAVADGAEAPSLAEQEGLEIELGTGVPCRASFLCERVDAPVVVILGQAVPVMSNDHAGLPLSLT